MFPLGLNYLTFGLEVVPQPFQLSSLHGGYGMMLRSTLIKVSQNSTEQYMRIQGVSGLTMQTYAQESCPTWMNFE